MGLFRQKRIELAQFLKSKPNLFKNWKFLQLKNINF